jgi:hypothetical protein
VILAISEWLRRLGVPFMHAQAGGFLAHPPGLDGQPAGLGEPALHGVSRARTWDAVVSAKAPRLVAGEVRFVALPDGSLVVDEEAPLGETAPLAEAVERSLRPPYRAVGVATGDGVWVIGAVRIHVVPVAEDVDGDDLVLSVGEEGKTVTLDGQPADVALDSLEEWAARHHSTYVVTASRLDDRNWEVELMPL